MEEIVKKKIVITGMGAVTPIGSGVEEYWNNLIAGACGIDKIRFAEVNAVSVAEKYAENEIRTTTTTISKAI